MVLVAVWPPSAVVTVTVAVPAATPFTVMVLPERVTVATAVLDDVAEIAGLLASEGDTLAVRVTFAPTATLAVVGLTLTPVTETLVTAEKSGVGEPAG